MNKKFTSILLLLSFLLFYHITRETDTFLFTVAFSLYLVLINIIPRNFLESNIKQYHNKNYQYSANKIFKYGLIFILLIGLIITLISYFFGYIININNLKIVILFMTTSVTTHWTMNLVYAYMEVNNKKISNNLLNIYQIFSFTFFIIILILSFKILKIPVYLKSSLLFLPNVITFLILLIILYFSYFKRKKIPKLKEEKKINYFKEIIKSIKINYNNTIYKIINSSYIYISIIILYFTLINRYCYKYSTSTNIINNTYFNALVIIIIIFMIIKKHYSNDLEYVKSSIQNKDKDLNKKVNGIINNVINSSLSIVIILSIISGPISKIIFNTNTNILLGLMPLLFTLIIYYLLLELNMTINKNKNIMLIILSGFIIKLVFELPLIDTIYRMGYSLSFGSVLANTLGLVTSIIVASFLMCKVLKISFLDNFNNLLNIIYENILLCVVLLLFTLLVSVTNTNYLESILVTIFYLFISSLFFLLKKILKKS